MTRENPAPASSEEETMAETPTETTLNRETELVRLWLMNDQDHYDGTRRMARAALLLDPQYPAVTLGDALRDGYDAGMPEVEGVWADLLRLAFGRVDWIELAREFITDVRDEGETPAPTASEEES